MRSNPFLFLVFAFSIRTFAQIPLEKMPTPAPSPNRLFYVQRSPNVNTVMYDVNLLANKKINAENPINVYWVLFDDKQRRLPLNYIQRNLAYGVECTPVANEPNNYDFRVVSYKKRRLKLITDDNGNHMALIPINGKMQQLQKVYVMIEETGRLIPKVLYIELFGRDLKTGGAIYERFKP